MAKRARSNRKARAQARARSAADRRRGGPPRSGTPAAPRAQIEPNGWVVAALLIGGALLGGLGGRALLASIVDLDRDPSAATLGIIVGVVSGALAGAGIGGGLIVVGWWGLVPGLAVGGVMFCAVVGSEAGDHGIDDGQPWFVAAAVLFVVTLVGYYVPGFARGWVPPGIVAAFASPGSLLVGIALLVLTDWDQPLLRMTGLGQVVVWVVLVTLMVVRRRRDDAVRSGGDRTAS